MKTYKALIEVEVEIEETEGPTDSGVLAAARRSIYDGAVKELIEVSPKYFEINALATVYVTRWVRATSEQEAITKFKEQGEVWQVFDGDKLSYPGTEVEYRKVAGFEVGQIPPEALLGTKDPSPRDIQEAAERFGPPPVYKNYDEYGVLKAKTRM